MNFINHNLPHIAAGMAALVIGLAAVAAFAQDTTKSRIVSENITKHNEFCSSDSWSSDSNVSFSQLREMNVPIGGTITVDGEQNGGVKVTGEDRGDVLVRACIQTWGKTDEDARAMAANIRVNTVGTIRADGPSDNHWSVSYQILVPRSSNLNLKAHNGGIAIRNVDGSAEFETMNGGVKLDNVSGSFKGRTTNGGVKVALTGSSWKGSGLDVTTTNGGVKLDIPANFAEHIETGTVNGGFSSDIPSLNVEKTTDQYGRRVRPTKVSADINGGGAPIRLVTTNGGVKISTPESEKE